MRSPCTSMKSSSRSLQLEKAHAQQQRPNAAKNKYIHTYIHTYIHKIFLKINWIFISFLHCPRHCERNKTRHDPLHRAWSPVGKKRLKWSHLMWIRFLLLLFLIPVAKSLGDSWYSGCLASMLLIRSLSYRISFSIYYKSQCLKLQGKIKFWKTVEGGKSK